MVENTTPIPNDDIKKFNHEYNVQYQINQCQFNSNRRDEFINAVEVLEMVILSDPTNKVSPVIDHKIAELKKDGEDLTSMDGKLHLAREKFRILYNHARTRRRAVVMAIGRPKCHNCGSEIRWNKVKEKKEEALDVPQPT